MSRTSIVIAIVLYLLFTLLFIVSTIMRKGGMGINFEALGNEVLCPRCGQAFPRRRIPRNFRQALWGGGTCENCGCECDKWGNR